MKSIIFIYNLLFLSLGIKSQTGCNVSSLDIRTGFDYNTNTVYTPPPSLSGVNQASSIADNYWRVISDNNPSTIEPRPAFVISQDPWWITMSSPPVPLSGCGTSNPYPIDPLTNYIRDYPTIQSSYTSNFQSTYEYEFCVNDKTGISLNLGIRAEGDAGIFINGNSLGKLSTYTGIPPSCSTSKYVSYYRYFQTNNPALFNLGSNKITVVAYYQPLGGTYSGINTGPGLNVSGQITGASGAFVKPSCCKNYIALSGSKYSDSNYNGIKDYFEGGLVGWQINLKNSAGTIIGSATTDVNGYYFFSNIPTGSSSNNISTLVAGIYNIEEVNSTGTGFFQISPSGSGLYSITTNLNQVRTNLDFGNAPCFNPTINIFGYDVDAPNYFGLNGIPISFLSNYNFVWDFGDGTSGSGPNPTHVYSTPGNKIITVTGYPITGSCMITSTKTITDNAINNNCPTCLPSFRPLPGRKYILSAWVSEEVIDAQQETFLDPQIYIKFGSITYGPYVAKGNIIDEWQRIDQEFTVPATATDITIQLVSRLGSTQAVYFDDVRVHPFDAGFKSYVYDPVTLKFTAELDNNNYATLYEYDEEGKLVRVKKETEKRRVTIKESRNSSKKR